MTSAERKAELIRINSEFKGISKPRSHKAEKEKYVDEPLAIDISVRSGKGQAHFSRKQPPHAVL